MGWSVLHTHTIGKGAPDIIIGKNMINILVEIKDGTKPPSARRLTPDEIKFHEAWRGKIVVVESLEDVLSLNKEYAG